MTDDAKIDAVLTLIEKHLAEHYWPPEPRASQEPPRTGLTAALLAIIQPSAYERNVLAAARELRHMGVVFQASGPWHHPAQSALARLVDAARQPEEAAHE